MPEWVLVDGVAPGPLTALSLSAGPAAALIAHLGLSVHGGRLYRPGSAVAGPERVCDGPLAELRGPLDRAVAAWVRADEAVRRADPPRAYVPPVAEQVRQLARVVAGDARLGRLFDRGPAELRSRLTASRIGSVHAFLQAVETTLAEWPHTGPGGWELAETDWEADPEHLLSVLDLLRHAPEPPAATSVADRDLRARNRAADAVERILHRQRRLVRDLGRAHAAAGRLVEPGDVVHLRADEPAGSVDPEAVRLRAYDHAALAARVPPPRCPGPPPSPVRWARADTVADAGTLLAGMPAAPGEAAGRVSAPADPRSFARAAGNGADEVAGLAGTGPVLVVGDTGPYWVPLLPGTRAVVARGGEVSAPVAAACRALGLPCVVGVAGVAGLADATRVHVDGTAGTVTVER